MASAAQRRDLAIAAFFVCLVFVPFMGKAYHIDEPLFLAPARQILADPRHPQAFEFNWYGRAMPMGRVINNPPTFSYLLAGALRLTGGGELPMRLIFLPLDILGAWGLYFLAERFLRRPLFPVLILIATPAYLINMNHLMGEKPVGALGFWGLYALVRGVDENRRRWLWLSALLVGLSIVTKYNAVFFLCPAAGYCLERRLPWRRLAAWLAAALAPLALALLFDRLSGGANLGSALTVTTQAAGLWRSGQVHKVRSFFAFTGGAGVVTAIWPHLKARRWRWAAAAACAFLFLPVFDLVSSIRWVDRLAGFFMSWGAVLGLSELFRGRGRGWGLWAPWVLCIAALELGVYWAVISRFILFLLPPLVFAMAQNFESDWDEAVLKRLYLASLGGVLALSLPLALVDYRYAGAQKALAGEVKTEFLDKGKRVWFTGHWGLQYYLEAAGARALDTNKGGWDQARPGDVVVAPKVNSNLFRPRSPRLSNVKVIRPECALPLRLFGGWDAEAGFYSNAFGFLPFSLSSEPLDEFSIVELL